MPRIDDISAILTSTNINPTCRELTFAGLFSFEPRVIKPWVAFLATLFEPSTAASTAAERFRFFHDGALGTCGTGFYCDGRRGDT